MKIELVTIGSELLSGITLNTNALFVGDQLGRIGLSLSRQVAIPDELAVIVSTLRESLDRADWVIVSGGLGPTHDDITKKAIAHVFLREMVSHEEILRELRERFTRAGRALTPLLDTQAELPQGAEAIPNPIGTAPGFYTTSGASILVAVPGVPREMRPMIADHVVPRIASLAKVTAVSATWSTTGIPESRLYEILEPAMNENPTIAVAFLPSEYSVRLRFSAAGAGAAITLATWCDRVRPMIGDFVYAESDIGLEVVLGELLRSRGLTIAFAESCTGGLAAKRMTDVPGSSTYVLAGFVTYSNEAKAGLLGVDPRLIEQYGAVSEEVARAMSEGASAKTGADCAISITGIAGPDGGTSDKPVGTVWISIAVRGNQTSAKRLQLLGNREMIRERATQAALNMLRLELQRA